MPGVLLYNGALTYGANHDAVRYFASEIYPILSKLYPGVKLLVTGRTTGVDLRGIEDCPGIELTGYVADMRDILATSAACAVPLRSGGGSRLKILEAMASGVPVVSTTMGAEGINCVNGEHILLADTAQSLAEAIAAVLTKPQLAENLAGNARRLVEQSYSWDSLGDQFRNIVESVVVRNI
jgi:glycosyltransferase involved in cell wall biosynthesis